LLRLLLLLLLWWWWLLSGKCCGWVGIERDRKL
jgi:hypothetical protein